MKPQLRLGFTDYFTWFDDFMIDVLKDKFEIVLDNQNPQILLFCDEVFGQNNLSYDPEKVIKVFYTGENRRPWNYKCHFAISFDHLDSFQHIRFPLYSLEDWVFRNKFKLKSLTELPRGVDIKEKTDFCGFVFSNGGCQERNNIFHKLSQYKTVDSGGPLFNNIGYLLPKNDETQIHKLNFFKSRKFSICYENSSYPGYVTEKLMHGFYMNTLPIYWGSPCVEMDFNPKAFISRHDFDSDEEMIEKIIEIDNNDELYMSMMNEPILNPRNKMLDLNRLVNFFTNRIYPVIRQ